jgi:hypothetical protein
VTGSAHLFFALTSARESINKWQMPMCPFVAEKNNAVRPPLLQTTSGCECARDNGSDVSAHPSIAFTSARQRIKR